MYKITILGDVMFQKAMLNFEYKKMFSNIEKYLSKSNLVIANLETPVKEFVKEDDIKQYQFVAPKLYVETLKDIGINMFSTANNHCLDGGKEGIIETINILDNIELEHIGTYKTKTEKRYIVKNVENKKIVFLANTYGTNAFVNDVYIDNNDEFHICMLQDQELKNKTLRKIYRSKNIFLRALKKIFRILHLFQFQKPIYERNEKNYLNEIKKEIREIKLKEKPDYILMMMHDGGQNNNAPIDRTIKRIKCMKKLGVNAIIANHEHMIHKVELQNNGIVTYSLGNFISVNGVTEEPFDKMQEYSIAINMYLDKDTIKYTFTILKIIFDKEENCIKVNSIYDLIKNEQDIAKKQELINDNRKIVNKVLKNNQEIEVKEEYEIKE